MKYFCLFILSLSCLIGCYNPKPDITFNYHARGGNPNIPLNIVSVAIGEPGDIYSIGDHYQHFKFPYSNIAGWDTLIIGSRHITQICGNDTIVTLQPIYKIEYFHDLKRFDEDMTQYLHLSGSDVGYCETVYDTDTYQYTINIYNTSHNFIYVYIESWTISKCHMYLLFEQIL